MSENTAPEPANRSLRRGDPLGSGFGSGRHNLLRVASSAGIAGRGDRCRSGDAWGTRSNYTYGWYFRAAGLVIAALAVILFLRGRGVCNVRGAYQYRRMLIVLVASGAVTYAGLFWFTKYLGIWFA